MSCALADLRLTACAYDRDAGSGFYLAEQARYSNGVSGSGHPYAHVFRDGSQEKRQLLLMRTALGRAFEFPDGEINKGLKHPPEESAGELYDSVRGGPHTPTRAGRGADDSYMFVVYDTSQAYSEYVVTYTI